MCVVLGTRHNMQVPVQTGHLTGHVKWYTHILLDLTNTTAKNLVSLTKMYSIILTIGMCYKTTKVLVSLAMSHMVVIYWSIIECMDSFLYWSVGGLPSKMFVFQIQWSFEKVFHELEPQPHVLIKSVLTVWFTFSTVIPTRRMYCFSS